MRSEYRPYQYVMQDITHVYVGCKFSLQDILNFEDSPFKLKSIVRKYFLPEASAMGDTLLEDFIFGVDPDSECYDVLKRLKTKVKFSIPKRFDRDAGYQNKTMSYVDFINAEEIRTHRNQIYVEEVSFSKLSMAALG